jgi:hypothetical protein
MAVLTTISGTVEIGDVSIYLAANDNSKGSLFSPRLASPTSPVLIAIVTDALRWQLEGDPTDDTLRGTSNYLLWLCGRYRLAAQAAISGGGGGGGSVVPGGGSASVVPLDWIVSATATVYAPLATGESTVTFDGTNGMRDLRGLEMEYTRGGQTQYTTDPGDGTSFYYWNKVSGVFIIYAAAAIEGERMRISPI